jgi:hypothetical protein
LDYWDSVFCKCHDSWDDFLEYFVAQEGPKRLVGFTKFGADIHTEEGAYQPGDWLLFGASPSPCTSHLRIFPLKPFSAICHPSRAWCISLGVYQHCTQLRLLLEGGSCGSCLPVRAPSGRWQGGGNKGHQDVKEIGVKEIGLLARVV